jgi:hypothetical protein
MNNNFDRFFISDNQFMASEPKPQMSEDLLFDHLTITSIAHVNNFMLSRHIIRKKATLVQNLQANCFPAPKVSRKHSSKWEELTSSTQDSLSTSEPQISNEISETKNFDQNNEIHYSLILPQNDKRSAAISLWAGVLAKRLLETPGFSFAEYSTFQSKLRSTIELLALNWDAVKWQQAESLAVSVLLSVVSDSNIKHKTLLDMLKEQENKHFTKISSIRKTKAYICLRTLLKRSN